MRIRTTVAVLLSIAAIPVGALVTSGDAGGAAKPCTSAEPHVGVVRFVHGFDPHRVAPRCPIA